ncbi:DUF4012 domain-containing protein [Microbacterium amylolyticum]|uniref:DUF4012 domain-containing protein n=1 Tax=Microbacterium amylolyticum TaxID=936337 RepID=UPI003616DEB4
MVNQVMQMAAPAIGVVPDLLGADEPRTYLLVFMNNAESVGLGGSAASQTLVTVDGGAFEIAAQGSSGDYLEGTPLENVDVPESAEALYGDFYGSYVNMSSARPHFPAMAEMVTEFWDRDVAPTLDNAASSRDIDGVISIDPIALGFILDATGPIHLATGDVMTSDNAVDLLLSDVYHRWNAYLEPEIVDGFFASVATEVFDKIASADFNLQAMLSSVTRGIDNGSIYFHSFHDEVQQHIDGEKVSGVLPTSNEVESTVGVFFRDESASKIDYYMKSNIDVNQTCSASGSEFRGRHDTAPRHRPRGGGCTARLCQECDVGSSQFRTAVYVYGVPGTTLESVQMDGREVRLVRDDVVDLDRPVAYFETYLQPGEIAKVTATFSVRVTSVRGPAIDADGAADHRPRERLRPGGVTLPSRT